MKIWHLVVFLALSGPATAEPLLTFTKVGGIAGISEKLAVSSCGVVTRTFGNTKNPREIQLTPEEIASLKEALKPVATVKVPPTPRGVADGYNYTLVSRGTTLKWGQPVEPPKELVPVLKQIESWRVSMTEK